MSLPMFCFFRIKNCQLHTNKSTILQNNVDLSSNLNEVIKAVLNYLFFYTKRFCTHQKHQKHQSTKAQPSKSTKRSKRTKIKNELKLILEEKRYLFASLRFRAFFMRAKKRKQKIEKREKSPQGNALNTDVPITRLMY